MASSNIAVQLLVQATTVVTVGRQTFPVVNMVSPAGATSGTYLPSGTASGQASDIFYPATQTVASTGTPTVFTLSTLTNPAGTACGFLHISHVLFENLDTVNTLTIEPGATHGVTWLPAAGIVLPPSVSANQSSCFLLAVPAGLPITAGAAETIQVVTSGGTNVQFNVTLVGRSA